jgi:Right handed beta helix region
VSYTLRGRLESRLASAALPFLVACVLAAALQAWWPLQLAGLMIAVGVALDATVYHRLLDYQPGWAALPLGLLELGLTMALAWRFDVAAPLVPALVFFAGSWLLAQILGHAVFPLLRLSYGEDGGELGRGGGALAAAAPAAVLAVVGVAWASQPPVVRLPEGLMQGPLVLDEPQTVIGDGTTVRGGIVIRSDDVTVRDVAVTGAPIGILVRKSEGVELERVHVTGATEDGISARESSLRIEDCRVEMPRKPYTQGIDISFAGHRAPSVVEGCSVRGGAEGIVAHMARISISENRVSRTGLRGIVVTEMSTGEISRNVVEDATGVGIYCGDYSHCEIVENSVSGTRRGDSEDASHAGFGVVSHFHAWAELEDNQLDRRAATFVHGFLEHR